MAADKLHDSGIVLMMSGIGPKRTCVVTRRYPLLGVKLTWQIYEYTP
jgi:hypothetical protein